MDSTPTRAFRGSVLHFLRDPGDAMAPGDAIQFFDDGLLVVEDGRVARVGEAQALLASLPPGTPVTDYTGRLILPGFVDVHVHYPQLDVIASYGEQLLEWLERYTYPAEARFGDAAHAREAAEFFLGELLRNGTTTASVFATVHPESVDAIFAAAQARRMRLVSGKVLMDRNVPEFLRDTAEGGYESSLALLDRWHGVDRLVYAVTPRFAPASTERQLELAGKLCADHPDVLLQSHVAENRDEVEFAARVFPWSRSYLDVYDRYGLLRPRAIYAHCIHLDDEDRVRMADTGTAAAFCPSSNLFLGSGLFDVWGTRECGVRVGLGSDVGGGTSLSLLRTMHDAYTVSQMAGERLSPFRAFYLATLGGAEALYQEDRIGSFAPDREADFAVLDWAATPLMARRMQHAETLAERLFVLMMLGDDRAVVATHVLGDPAYVRDAIGHAVQPRSTTTNERESP